MIRTLLRIAIGAFILVGLLSLRADAQEQYTLTTPQTTSATTYTIDFIFLNWRGHTLEVQVEDNTGKTFYKAYGPTTTPTGDALMIALNKANLTTSSLYKRTLLQLASDGTIPPGSVTGSPQ